MLQFVAEWHYVAFWRVSMPGLGLDYFACVWKEGAKDDDLVYRGIFRFRQSVNATEQWYTWIAKEGDDEESVIKVFNDTVVKIKAEAGGGESDYLPIDSGGVEAYSLLLEQPWTYKVEPPEIIRGTDPNLEELLDSARKSVERLGD